MYFINMLLPSILGLITFLAFTSAKPITTAVESTSARDIDIVGPPAVVIERLCCKSDCETCFGSCNLIGCPVFPSTTCCVRPLPAKRDDDPKAAIQNRELGQFVDILESKSVLPHEKEPLHHKQAEKGQDSRDVDMVGPPAGRPYSPVELCCHRDCYHCSDVVFCPGPNYDCGGGTFPICCAAMVWRDKRDGTEQTFNLKGELVQWVTLAGGPVLGRGVDK